MDQSRGFGFDNVFEGGLAMTPCLMRVFEYDNVLERVLAWITCIRMTWGFAYDGMLG